MKNSQRILDSIGKLDDSLIEGAVSYKPETETKSRKKMMISSARPVKKLIAASVAAVMCVALAITCFANAEGITEAIKSIFNRDEELIDPYAAMIDESIETEGISMTVDKIVKDDKDYLIYIHMRNPSGFEPGYLFYDSIKIEQQTKKGWETMCELIGAGKKSPEVALLAGTQWTNVETKTQDLDLFVKIGDEFVNSESMYAGIKKNNYRISVYNLLTIQILNDSEGNFRSLEPYFDELTVDFEFDGSKVEPLPEKISYPNAEFEVDGTEFVITEIRYSPLHLALVVEDPNSEIFEVGGLHFYGTSKLNMYTFCEEYPPAGTRSVDESKGLYDIVYELGLIQGVHSLYVETSVSDKECGYRMSYAMKDGVYDHNKLIFTYFFNKPVYEEEIKEIGFEAYIYDEYPITADTGYTIDRVVAWENPNYKSNDE